MCVLNHSIFAAFDTLKPGSESQTPYKARRLPKSSMQLEKNENSICYVFTIFQHLGC